MATCTPWLVEAGGTLLASFGKGTSNDLAAVRAALSEAWSNGQTEGQITKLKLIKRQMHGRARLDLLRARLVVAACNERTICSESEAEPIPVVPSAGRLGAVALSSPPMMRHYLEQSQGSGLRRRQLG